MWNVWLPHCLSSQECGSVGRVKKKVDDKREKGKEKNPGSLDTTHYSAGSVCLLSPYVSDAGNFWTALKIDRNEIEKVNLVSIIILVVRQFS